MSYESLIRKWVRRIGELCLCTAVASWVCYGLGVISSSLALQLLIGSVIVTLCAFVAVIMDPYI
jgi:hypothetical protein